MGNKKRTILVLLAVVLAAAVGGVAVYSYMSYKNMVELPGNDLVVSKYPSEQNGEAVADDKSPIIGGQKDRHDCLVPAGYQWCPSTNKCQRMWEEYCEEYKDQYRGDGLEEEKNLPADSAPGDVGENPPEYTNSWPVYENTEEQFKFQYPDKYKTVVDNYGWPQSVVHLIEKAGGQSYDVTFEAWGDQGEAEAKAESADRLAKVFFGMSENPKTGKYISITCWNPETKKDCEDIYATLTFQ